MIQKIKQPLCIIGSLVTLAFGFWHFVVPYLYKWFSYTPRIPLELKNGILATNYFLSVCLVLLGGLSLYIFIWKQKEKSTVRAILIVMNILWLNRVLYQIIKPQGLMIPGLRIGLLIVFTISFLLFLIPLIADFKK